MKNVRIVRCATYSIVALAMALFIAPATVVATVFVVNTGFGLTNDGTIGAYTDSGVPINASFITGLSLPQFVAISDGFLYVTSLNGTVGKYTTSGATVNASLITGLNQPVDIEVSGGHLFISNFGNGTVGEYTTSGATVNASLITGLDRPIGLAVSEGRLFVASRSTVGEYTTSGATINPSLIGDLSPVDVEASGSDLFVSYAVIDDSFVGKYRLDGTPIDPTLTPFLPLANGIAVSGTDLFVVEDTTVGRFTTSGAVIADPLISDLRNGVPFGIAVEGPASVPETLSTWWLALTATGLLSLAHSRRAKQKA